MSSLAGTTLLHARLHWRPWLFKKIRATKREAYDIIVNKQQPRQRQVNMIAARASDHDCRALADGGCQGRRLGGQIAHSSHSLISFQPLLMDCTRNFSFSGVQVSEKSG